MSATGPAVIDKTVQTADPAAILPAAHDGRIDTLFLAEGADLWGRYDDAAHAAAIHEERKDADEELLDAAAVETLRRKGTRCPAEASPRPCCAAEPDPSVRATFPSRLQASGRGFPAGGHLAVRALGMPRIRPKSPFFPHRLPCIPWQVVNLISL